MKKPSRPKAEIEPIHVPELLSAAGMCNFLGVLSPPAPVPHLRKLVDSVDRVAREVLQGRVNDAPRWEGIQFLTDFSAHAELLLAELARQHETLVAILTRAERMNRSVVWLSAAIRNRAETKFPSRVPQLLGARFWRPVNRRES